MIFLLNNSLLLVYVELTIVEQKDRFFTIKEGVGWVLTGKLFPKLIGQKLLYKGYKAGMAHYYSSVSDFRYFQMHTSSVYFPTVLEFS